MKLICPMFSSSHRWNECKKEECAWWDEESGQCCIFIGLTNLEFIKLRLERLVDKMPHEEQFRK